MWHRQSRLRSAASPWLACVHSDWCSVNLALGRTRWSVHKVHEINTVSALYFILPQIQHRFSILIGVGNEMRWSPNLASVDWVISLTLCAAVSEGTIKSFAYTKVVLSPPPPPGTFLFVAGDSSLEKVGSPGLTYLCLSCKRANTTRCKFAPWGSWIAIM